MASPRSSRSEDQKSDRSDRRGHRRLNLCIGSQSHRRLLRDTTIITTTGDEKVHPPLLPTQHLPNLLDLLTNLLLRSPSHLINDKRESHTKLHHQLHRTLNDREEESENAQKPNSGPKSTSRSSGTNRRRSPSNNSNNGESSMKRSRSKI